MAQYDVYANPDPVSSASVPYLVDVQSDILSSLATRLVVPLSRVGMAGTGMPRRLAPIVLVGGERLSVHAHRAAGIEARHLRRSVGSVAAHAGDIREAFDAVIGGV